MLKFLCRGSGFSGENNAAYVEVGEDLILIDCGYTVFNAIREKLDLAKYNNVYIITTHLHPDHAGSLGQLIMYMRYVLNKKPHILSICEKMQKYLGACGVDRKFYFLKESCPYNIKFIKTTHSEFLDAYGFSLEINGKKIVYTGDTATLDPFEKHIEGAYELYVDVSKNGVIHLKIDEVFEKLIAIQNVGTKVFLMHLDDEEYISKVVQGKLEFAKLA